MLYLDLLLILLIAIGVICSLLAAKPKPFPDPPRHVLICCAHSDDCVITGVEYACGTVRNGLSVEIAYLTCSAPHPDTETAKIRKTEALAAWSRLGVAEKNFTFINLSESPVRGPLTYSDNDIENAKENFKALILSLPQNAAVIIPAQGEYHVDHRTVRKITLCAVVDSKRGDLIVYEKSGIQCVSISRALPQASHSGGTEKRAVIEPAH